MTLTCKTNEFGITTLDVLVAGESGLLSCEQVYIERAGDGIQCAATGSPVELRKVDGSILGWGDFDQHAEHWKLGNWIISAEQAAALGV